MFWRLKNRARRLLYHIQCRQAYQTAPLQMQPAPLKFVTMCCHDDLIMYLLAIKSLYRKIGEGSVVILSDGSLTARDKAILSHHIPNIAIENIQDVSNTECPKGGCWERLLRTIELSKESYVIQVDADTLTLDATPEVIQCYRQNVAFTLGTSPNQRLLSFEEVSAEHAVYDAGSPHVQIMAQNRLVDLASPLFHKYTYGCAGFTGLPKAGVSRSQAIEFSNAMSRFLGGKWLEWGSEQVTSNAIIANLPGATVLPFPRYASYWPGNSIADSAFLHFIGPGRFHKNVYVRESKKVIAQFAHRNSHRESKGQSS